MRVLALSCALVLLFAGSASAQLSGLTDEQQAALAAAAASNGGALGGASLGASRSGASTLGAPGAGAAMRAGAATSDSMILAPSATPTFGAALPLPQTPPTTAVGVTNAGGFITTTDNVQIPVFATDLFTGSYAGTRPGDRPDYVIQPGDMIAVNLFGAVNTGANQEVDAAGNVYLPGVGPVHVGGTPASRLQATVSIAVHSVFNQSIGVYATIAQAGSIGVYVSGSINHPGRYTGGARDGILYYLLQAGGIDPARGSFRNIQVQRNGRIIGFYDLYDFKLNGRLEPIAFQDGDVIVVAPRGPMVGVTGAARNAFAFEAPRGADRLTGADIIPMARIEPTVTSAAVSGFRNGSPKSTYLPLEDFSRLVLSDGDHVDFRSDSFVDTVTITLQGEIKGPSVIVLPRGSTLSQLLAKVPLDGTDIEQKWVHVQRREVAAEQKRAIDQALFNLQQQVVTAAPSTTEAAALATAQAQLINQFVELAKTVVPDGNIAVYNDGKFQDLRLQDGDVVILPNRTDVVIVSGQVLNPGGLAHTDRMRITDYVNRAGGYSPHANKSKVVVRHRDGSATVANASFKPEAGDEIVVLPTVGSGYFQLVKDVSTLLFQLAVTTSTVLNLNNNN